MAFIKFLLICALVSLGFFLFWLTRNVWELFQLKRWRKRQEEISRKEQERRKRLEVIITAPLHRPRSVDPARSYVPGASVQRVRAGVAAQQPCNAGTMTSSAFPSATSSILLDDRDVDRAPAQHETAPGVFQQEPGGGSFSGAGAVGSWGGGSTNDANSSSSSSRD